MFCDWIVSGDFPAIFFPERECHCIAAQRASFNRSVFPAVSFSVVSGGDGTQWFFVVALSIDVMCELLTRFFSAAKSSGGCEIAFL